MLDFDLAELYEVTTGNLNLAVRRNKNRFPEDFMFQLSAEETKSLLLQTARAKGRGGRQTPPYAFTEQGVAMLSSVLRSERAVQVNVQIMRAFVRMRQLLASHKGLLQKILAMEKKYDKNFQVVFRAIQLLAEEEEKPKHQIGFSADEQE